MVLFPRPSRGHRFAWIPLAALGAALTLACSPAGEGEGVEGPRSGVAGSPSVPSGAAQDDPVLRFHPDGSFKIVQFTDTQDDHEIDPRTVRLLEAVLDDQEPDLVVFTGDNIRGGPETPDQARQAMDNIIGPLEARGIPWLVAFGNHDEDHTPATGVDEDAQLAYYMTFPNNLNRVDPPGVSGTGNVFVLVEGSDGGTPAFAVWALDSGRYSSDSISGQSVSDDGLRSYDWIRSSQIDWYRRISAALESDFGRGIPGLMFFHIPIPEFALMWEHRENHGVTGEKNEDVAAGTFNSGLFAAAKERGDVVGIFVGHDHVNDYVGDYFGIRLGYSGNTGFGTYGLQGDDPDRLRGARVFLLQEGNPKGFETFMVYARSFGI